MHKMNGFIIIKVYYITCAINFIAFISCSNDVDIKNVAIKLGDDLLHIKNEELGVPFISVTNISENSNKSTNFI